MGPRHPHGHGHMDPDGRAGLPGFPLRRVPPLPRDSHPGAHVCSVCHCHPIAGVAPRSHPPGGREGLHQWSWEGLCEVQLRSESGNQGEETASATHALPEAAQAGFGGGCKVRLRPAHAADRILQRPGTERLPVHLPGHPQGHDSGPVPLHGPGPLPDPALGAPRRPVGCGGQARDVVLRVDRNGPAAVEGGGPHLRHQHLRLDRGQHALQGGGQFSSCGQVRPGGG
mmetsp:Transcript_72751/g.224721  ORF Transcript_72751/g.224721 Transcript_72751/m.224721 type:complete len:227 (-) Transcript_72751:374-1054(-)